MLAEGVRIYYVAGPITGMPNLNRDAFAAEVASLREAGYGALNPHDIPNPTGMHDMSGEEIWGYFMRRCLCLIAEATHMRFLPGWQNSRGACLEHKIALTLGIPCEYVREPE